MTALLRPEARPARWDSLYGDQQAVIRQLAELLEAAVTALPELPPPQQPLRSHWSAEQRSSQQAFLFGARGSGKTTVFLTLEEACNAQRLNAVISHYPPDLGQRMFELRRRLIWLRPLDMETAGESPNLLASLVARLEERCQPLVGGRDACTRVRPAGLLAAQAVDPLLELQRLQTKIAIAWDSNLPQRRGHLDPTNYAAEAMRYEQARMTLIDNLDQVLCQVGRWLQASGECTNPLFVLPVDDFDLNPAACLELLRVLRMVSLPRLFFLVLGSLDVAEVTLNLKLSNDLARLGHEASNSSLLSLLPAEVQGVAGEVAANAIRKLIPPSQRVTLHSLQLHEALDLRPLGPDRRHCPTMRDLLTACQVETRFGDSVAEMGTQRTRSESLLNFLTAPGTTLISWESPLPPTASATPPAATPPAASSPVVTSRAPAANGYYSGSELLCAPARQLIDLWQGLSRLVASAPPAGADHDQFAHQQDRQRLFFAEQCAHALLEEPHLSPPMRRALVDAFIPDASHRWHLSRLPLQLLAETTPRYFLVPPSLVDDLEETESSDVAAQPVPEFTFHQATGWQLLPLSPGGPGFETGEGHYRLRRSTAALITVFHDLVIRGPWTPARGSLVLGNELLTNTWARTVWRIGSESVELPWLRPACATVNLLDDFRKLWNDFLDAAFSFTPPTWEQTDVVAFGWLAAGTVALAGANASRFFTPLSSRELELHWEQLFQTLDQLVPRADDRSYSAQINREWLGRVRLLLDPVSGVPWKKLPSIRSYSRLDLYWRQESRRSFQQLKAEWLRPLRDAFPEQCQQIEARKTRHRSVESRRGGSAAPPARPVKRSPRTRRPPA